MLLEKVIPPSPEEVRRGSGVSKEAASNWKIYRQACNTRYKVVRNLAEQVLGDHWDGKIALDWGSAVGGVAILMDHNLPAKLYASDVDEYAMAWLKNTNPRITCTTLIPGKRLPFAENTFDLFYGISVLTHIPPKWQEFYLSELCRVCKVGGAGILTVKGYASCDANKVEGKDPKRHPWERQELKSKGIIYNSYKLSLLAKMSFAKSESYGITYHSREYVERVFSKYFDILKIEEAAIGKQDAVVLLKA